ncbi:hypothetical protein PG997_010148 [Apiospora hydei]|uniref:Uncharacterized protein n=1 Tax=Apiospora hydei TaxID=1337664 RepID=A0ABR1VZ93_9PEZI
MDTLDGPIGLSKKEISNVFTKVMSPIVGFINEQISDMAGDGDNIKEEDMPEFVILVGGYGRSNFLYEYLQKNLDQDIEILQSQGSRPWSAICRGAALSVIKRKTLVGPVLQRKARQSYGWLTKDDWDPEKHTEGVDEKGFDDIRGKFMANNQFNWPVIAGDDVNSNVVSLPYNIAFPMNRHGQHGFQADIYKTRSPNPPSRLNPEDRNVQKVGGLDLNFPVLIENLTARKNSQGELVRNLDYVTKCKVSGDSFDIWAEYNGEKVGELELDLDVAECVS